MITFEAIEYIESTVREILKKITPKKVKEIIDLFAKANRIFIYGTGRSGLVGKAFAIRLVHLGFQTFVIGETIIAPVKKGDLVLLISGSGETIPVTMTAEIVKRLGAKIISITANENSHIARYGDVSVILSPKKRNVELAPLGTSFEVGAWLFLDGLVAELMDWKGETEEKMRKRHATLEQ